MSNNILIVEDDSLLLTSLIAVARQEGHHTDGAQDGMVALGLIRSYNYDLVITDICMPNLNGIELIGHLRSINSSALFIAITGFASVEYAVSCLRYGASDFLEKPFTEKEFVDCIRATLAHLPQIQHQHQIQQSCEDTDAALLNSANRLTAREFEVLKWAKEGKHNSEISCILGISTATVKFHLSNVFKKLAVANRTQAAAQHRTNTSSKNV